MRLARLFSRPRWQSKHAATRREAVSRDQDPELLASLASLARDDEDSSVRIAALRRLADASLSQARARDDSSADVRSAAAELFASLLTGTHAAAPPLADRLRLLRAQDDVRLIEQIACHAPEPELRSAALARVERKALIAERATADDDADVRAAALARIDDETQLARIADRARRSDKLISRLAAERLLELRLTRGDAEAIATTARQICEGMERCLRETCSDEDVARLTRDWERIAARAPADLVARHANAKSLLDLARNPGRLARLRERAGIRSRLEAGMRALESQLAQATPPPRAEMLAAFEAVQREHDRYADDNEETGSEVSVRFARLAAQLAALADAEPEPSPPAVADQAEPESAPNASGSETQVSRKKARVEADPKVLETAIRALADALDGGHSAAAHAAHARLVEWRRSGARIPAALRETMAEVESGYAQLLDAHRWSDNQRRQQLCEELATLASSGLHPDALATRLKEIQQEWSTLDRLGLGHGRAGHALHRRFRELCQQVMAPARPYFEKRQALRKQGSEHTQGLIESIASELEKEEADARSLGAARRQAADALRGLDRVDPAQRKALAERLKALLTGIDARLAAMADAVATTKSGLITKAEALSSGSDLQVAMREARDLQNAWKVAGTGKRGRDEAQWRQFRQAIDAVFARADARRAEQRAEQDQARAQATDICAELENWIESDSPDRAAIQRLVSAWNALAVGEPALRQRFDAARQALAERERQAARRQRQARFHAWLAHYALVREHDAGAIDRAALEAGRTALPALELHVEAMQARAVAVPSADDPEASEALGDCVLEAEQLAGIESPSTERQRRMDLQVGKLSARMRGERAPSPAEALHGLLGNWLELGARSRPASELETRFRNAIEAVLSQLD